MKFETYLLPAYWASALVNSDASGMEDEDEHAMNAWFDATFPHGAHCVDVGEETELTRYHDACGFSPYACDCATFTFDVLEK